MIMDLLFLILLAIMGIVKTLLAGISLVIPASVETSITTTLSSIGTKFNTVYHMIPAADQLLIIVGLMITISSVLLGLRIFIFFYNKARGSGGNI